MEKLFGGFSANHHDACTHDRACEQNVCHLHIDFPGVHL